MFRLNSFSYLLLYGTIATFVASQSPEFPQVLIFPDVSEACGYLESCHSLVVDNAID